MLIRFLHWLAKDALPDRLWARWLRWRYRRENRQARDPECRFYRLGYGDTCTCTRCINRRSLRTFTPQMTQGELADAVREQEQARSKRLEHQDRTRQPEVYDCGCPVARMADGTITRQYHDSPCKYGEAYIPLAPKYNSGGVIRVDRHLIPHRPGRGICDCAACNPSGATFTC